MKNVRYISVPLHRLQLVHVTKLNHHQSLCRTQIAAHSTVFSWQSVSTSLSWDSTEGHGWEKMATSIGR